jgi:hypothetical protein
MPNNGSEAIGKSDTPSVPETVAELEIMDPQQDMFGPVTHALSLQDVQRSIRGVSRPRDLRPLIQKSTHDPLMNMLELAMQAKLAGNDSLAFNRFAECLPYVWTRVSMASMQLPGEGGAPGTAGEVVYRWANAGEA